MIFEPDGYTNYQAPIYIMLIISISGQNGVRGWFCNPIPGSCVELYDFFGMAAIAIAGEIVADYLFVDDPERNIGNLRHHQSGKPYKILLERCVLSAMNKRN